MVFYYKLYVLFIYMCLCVCHALFSFTLFIYLQFNFLTPTTTYGICVYLLYFLLSLHYIYNTNCAFIYSLCLSITIKSKIYKVFLFFILPFTVHIICSLNQMLFFFSFLFFSLACEVPLHLQLIERNT